MWLLVLSAVYAAAFGLVWRLFVGTDNGQRLDTIALTGNSIGRDRIDGLVNSVLDAMSIAALAVVTLAIGFIALMRRRAALAVVVTVFIIGANAMVQGLKSAIDRPDFGVDPQRVSAGNSLPSGHTAVAASFAVALVLVLPHRARGAGAVLGAGYAALVGVATLSEGWHRPSDAVAAILVVGAWAAAAGSLLLVMQPRQDVADPEADGAVYGGGHSLATKILAVGGLAMLAVAGIGLLLTTQVLSVSPDDLSRRRLFTAYGGSALGIAGTAFLMMSLVVSTVHRVVPPRS